MAIFFGIYLLLCLSGVRFRKGQQGLDTYLTKEHTQAVKGIFILLVFFSHFGSYVSYTSYPDLLSRRVVSWFGQAMVAMFLFYSGFGVMESIEKKGRSYVHAMPRKRVLSTLLRFDCAVMLHALVALAVSSEITLDKFLQALIGWKSIGNSNGYIFDILVLYLITYVAFSWFQEEKIAILAVLAGSCLMMLLLCTVGGKAIHWYDTVRCYWLGMVYSVQRERIEKQFRERKGLWFVWVAVLVGVSHVLSDVSHIAPLAIVRNLCFGGFVVILTMRVQISGRVLSWCGRNLFPLYILQRIPMILLKYAGLAQRSIPAYFLACGTITLALVFPFNWVTDRIVAAVGRIPGSIDGVK